jgi:hypothetical protein
MTKKHYEAIAKVLRENDNKYDIVHALVDAFAADNPRFDPGRFLAAANGCQICGEPWGH